MMADIKHRLLIKASPEKVFHSISTQEGLAAWRTPATTVKGQSATFSFGPDYKKTMEVVAHKSPLLLEWVCKEAHPERIETSVRFNIEPHKDGALVVFEHNGWKSYSDMFAQCSYDRAMFLRSLRLLCETGKGLPFPNQHQ